jgi:hypothetical protein
MRITIIVIAENNSSPSIGMFPSSVHHLLDSDQPHSSHTMRKRVTRKRIVPNPQIGHGDGVMKR